MLPRELSISFGELAPRLFPPRLSLKQRKIAQDPTCPICNEMDESVEHLLLQCPWVETVWFGSMDLAVDKRSITSFDEWLQDIIEKRKDSKEQRELFATKIAFMVWTIWKCRCDSIFKHKAVDPLQCLLKNQSACWNFIKTRTDHSHCKNRVNIDRKAPEVGSPPPSNFLKINSNGFFKDGQARIGVVVRNDTGLVVDGADAPVQANSALETEAKALP